jgi:hypothetical protein
LLACMTANREPSNQSFEIDREATVCTASRRFLPLCGAAGNGRRGKFFELNVSCFPHASQSQFLGNIAPRKLM